MTSSLEPFWGTNPKVTPWYPNFSVGEKFDVWTSVYHNWFFSAFTNPVKSSRCAPKSRDQLMMLSTCHSKVLFPWRRAYPPWDQLGFALSSYSKRFLKSIRVVKLEVN